MYRYDNYTDSFVRIDGEPNTGSTTIRVGVPLKETAIVEKVELTDECINKIADAVLQKLRAEQTEPQKDCKKCKNYDRCKNNHWKCCVYQPKDEPKTEPNCSEKPNNCEDEPQTDCPWK